MKKTTFTKKELKQIRAMCKQSTKKLQELKKHISPLTLLATMQDYNRQGDT